MQPREIENLMVLPAFAFRPMPQPMVGTTCGCGCSADVKVKGEPYCWSCADDEHGIERMRR